MRISDWSSDVCSSDLLSLHAWMKHAEEGDDAASLDYGLTTMGRREINIEAAVSRCSGMPEYVFVHPEDHISDADVYRSEEHTSELQSLMRISYAVFCLKKKIHTHHKNQIISRQ